MDQLQQTLGSRYTLERELSGGGMSRVFLAEETSLGRKVVVKLLPAELAATVNVGRFRREIKLAARLQHPHIVPLLEAGVSGEIPYYTMPFIEGESLRSRLVASGSLSFDEVVRIVRDVLNALRYAHEHGVIHRDIKPENILLTSHDALVTDFGVAKALDAATNSEVNRTTVGVVLGTPGYMAPEQALADPTADHRADLYSVGAVAYEMVAGRPVFTGRSAQALFAAHAIERPEPIDKRRRSIPSQLSRLIMRALEKNPDDRPQSANEMLLALEGPTGSASTGYRLRVYESRPWLAGATVALIAILAFAGFRAYSNRRPLDPNLVFIAPFQNKTGDPELDQLGSISTDWITRGINETGLVDLASFTPHHDKSGQLVSSELEPAALKNRARALGAQSFISGAFYLAGDSVQFQAEIRDAADGKRLGLVPQAVASRKDPMPAVNAMRGRIMSALVALTAPGLRRANNVDRPPLYPAYQEFERGDQAFDRGEFEKAIPYYRRAFVLDSTFYAAPVVEAYSYQNLGRCAETDSVGRFLNAKRDQLSEYQAAYLDRVLAWCRGDWNAAYVAAKQMAALAPKSSFARFISVRSLIPINRLNEAAEGLEKLDWHKEHSRNYYLDLTYVLHKLGKHERELEVAQYFREHTAGPLESLECNISALAALGRVEEVRQIVRQTMAMPSRENRDTRDLMKTASDELGAHGHPDAAREMGTELVNWLRTRLQKKQTDAVRPRELIRAGDFDEARRLAKRNVARLPNDKTAIADDGITAAIVGDSASAARASDRLGSLNQPYLFGENIFYQALIASVLRQREDAVRYLRDAFRAGFSFSQVSDAVPELLPLHGYPPYEELMRPSG